jgi:methylmalonyl-CoA/ethylmalonyl-CoA epimerase
MTPVSTVAQQFNLGAVNQVAFVVRSIDRSLSVFEPIFGKFQVYEIGAEVTYRGQRIQARLKTALAQSGQVQIELCEAVDGGPPHGEYLQRHGEGLYHVRFKVDCLRDTVRAMENAGFTAFYSGDMKSVRFAYLEAPEAFGHIVIELIEPIPAGAPA